MTFLFNIGFLDFNFIDFVDIALVTLLIYQLYQLLRGSVAFNIVLGIFAIYLFYLVVDALHMELLSTILGQFIGVGVIAMVILFQQEIRKFLLYIGRSTVIGNEQIKSLLHFTNKNIQEESLQINTIVKAVQELSTNESGALIVLMKSDELKFYIDSGDFLDALVSKRLLISIFYKNSPLHDGAVIIKGNRILAARCIIPVTEREDLPANYGLRHRAAIGLSEVTDSIVLIVSEETGSISLSIEGELLYDLTSTEVRSIINQKMFSNSDQEKIKEANAAAKNAPAT